MKKQTTVSFFIGNSTEPEKSEIFESRKIAFKKATSPAWEPNSYNFFEDNAYVEIKDTDTGDLIKRIDR